MEIAVSPIGIISPTRGKVNKVFGGGIYSGPGPTMTATLPSVHTYGMIDGGGGAMMIKVSQYAYWLSEVFPEWNISVSGGECLMTTNLLNGPMVKSIDYYDGEKDSFGGKDVFESIVEKADSFRIQINPFGTVEMVFQFHGTENSDGFHILGTPGENTLAKYAKLNENNESEPEPEITISPETAVEIFREIDDAVNGKAISGVDMAAFSVWKDLSQSCSNLRRFMNGFEMDFNTPCEAVPHGWFDFSAYAERQEISTTLSGDGKRWFLEAIKKSSSVDFEAYKYEGGVAFSILFGAENVYL